MKIHEYQGKQIFARHGVPVPKGMACFSAEEAKSAAEKLIQQTGQPVVVVKAQIHAGGRGKGGGVKVVTSGAAEVERVAAQMLGSTLVTHQTGPEGRKVNRLYVEEGLAIARELYLSLVLDRSQGRVVVMASSSGGVDIEEVAKTRPDEIIRETVAGIGGLDAYQARRFAFRLGLGSTSPAPKATVQQFVETLLKLTRLFELEDCSLCEINPLVITREGQVVALDSKLVFDDNASIRHPEWASLVDPTEEDPVELEAKRAGLSYVALDGNIGCLVNGAGLAMATMDIIKHWGGSPANFLDVGGGASSDAVTKAFSMILSSRHVKGVFVNIFGGIMRCDVIADGIVQATRKLQLNVPLVVRLAGTNVDQGKEILLRSGLRIESADSLGEGAKKIVAAVRRHSQPVAGVSGGI
jgi:succinyl-CoA synthetase beta subunit